MSVCEVSLFALLYVHKGIRHRSLHFPFVLFFLFFFAVKIFGASIGPPSQRFAFTFSIFHTAKDKKREASVHLPDRRR